MGSVFEAVHKATGRRVAVKVILDEARVDPAVVARFDREARAVGSIDSDHITQVLDAGVDAETQSPYLVMELLAGEDVATLLKRLGPLRPDLALRIVAQMLDGLDRAHEAGVVHRDVKPANVFLAKKSKGDARVVKICDFGIAKVKVDTLGGSQDHALTRSSTLLGSPTYMSPEQVKGSKGLDRRADVWSAGIVLYELLAGATPHSHADTLGLLFLAICSAAPESVRSQAGWVPPEIDAVLVRALELDREQRFQSAREMRDAILALLPNGTEIDDAMLTPMAGEERAHISRESSSIAFGATAAERIPKTEPAPKTEQAGRVAKAAPAPSLSSPSPSSKDLEVTPRERAPGGQTLHSAAAVTAGTAPTERQSSRGRFALGALVLVGGAVAVTTLVRYGPTSSTEANGAPSAARLISPPPEPSEAPTVTPTAASAGTPARVEQDTSREAASAVASVTAPRESVDASVSPIASSPRAAPRAGQPSRAVAVPTTRASAAAAPSISPSKTAAPVESIRRQFE
jgi:serine/threonine-protein kinase